MNLVTNSIELVAAVGLTLGLIQLRMCFQSRDRWTHVLFVAAAFSLAIFAWIERGMMLASSPVEYGQLVRWLHLPGSVMLISIPWFFHLYLRAGRRWLLWGCTTLRLAALVINFIRYPNLNFNEITGMAPIFLLGQDLYVPVATLSYFTLVGQGSLLLFAVFCFDAVIEVWRKQAPWRVVRMGAAAAIFAICNLAYHFTVLWGEVKMPNIASLFFGVVVFTMMYELSLDLYHSAGLAEDLKKREASLRDSLDHLNLTAGAANVGVTTYDLATQEVWASEKWREIFRFDPSEVITLENYTQKIHPSDRESVEHTLMAAMKNGDHYETEYRIKLPDGNVRWIASRGRVDIDGEPKLLRAACVDITKRKEAEKSAHDLSHKLIYAQELERARLARELHDDLSQSLAMLSMQVDVLGQARAEPQVLWSKTRQIMGEIHRLSTDVHRISHELHPAKLGQLGLEAAMRGFCREIGEARGLMVDFEAADVPRLMSNELELCLYRVAQESLQNIVKHSGARRARVQLERRDHHISLTITDDGRGFDTGAASHRESLGLISMQERMLSVDGTLTIRSEPADGTQITAVVPFREVAVKSAVDTRKASVPVG